MHWNNFQCHLTRTETTIVFHAGAIKILHSTNTYTKIFHKIHCEATFNFLHKLLKHALVHLLRAANRTMLILYFLEYFLQKQYLTFFKHESSPYSSAISPVSQNL